MPATLHVQTGAGNVEARHYVQNPRKSEANAGRRVPER